MALNWSTCSAGFAFRISLTCVMQHYLVFWRQFQINLCIRAAISAEGKLLTVSMATFCDTKQALCGTFQNVLTTTNPSQNNITLTEGKYHKIVEQYILKRIKCKGHFFIPNPEYSYFSEDIMIRSSETIKNMGK